MSEWISVQDRLPKHMDAVLVTDGVKVTAAEFFMEAYQGGRRPTWLAHLVEGYEWDWDFDKTLVTHWMTLPSPPPQEPKHE